MGRSKHAASTARTGWRAYRHANERKPLKPLNGGSAEEDGVSADRRRASMLRALHHGRLVHEQSKAAVVDAGAAEGLQRKAAGHLADRRAAVATRQAARARRRLRLDGHHQPRRGAPAARARDVARVRWQARARERLTLTLTLTRMANPHPSPYPNPNQVSSCTRTARAPRRRSRRTTSAARSPRHGPPT
eukprot:scaffold108148_cov51-Phaeocystis_antarctica.AAC.1